MKNIKRKKAIRDFYELHIDKIDGLKLAETPSYSINNNWLNVIQIDKKKYKKNKIQIMKMLLNSGIETRPVWKLNHLQKPYKKYQRYNIKLAKDLTSISLCLPSSYNLKKEQLKKIINCLNY